MIEIAIKSAIEALSGMAVYPLLLPDTVQEGITFQLISDPAVDGGMVQTGVIAGRFQISMYKVDDYTGLVQLDKRIWQSWCQIRQGSVGGYPVQYVERGGIVQNSATLNNNRIQYRLARDFILYYREVAT